MAAAGVLTNAQGTDQNLNTSIWQLIYSSIKLPYDTAASAASLNAGLSLNKDSTYTADSLGLGIIDMDIDSDGLYKRVPAIGYMLDNGPAKPSKVIGAGDKANWEWRNVILTCVPTVNVAAGSDATQSANRLAIMMLKSAVVNAIMRQYSFPIVDSTQTRVANLYPAIGYAIIEDAVVPKRPEYKDNLVIDRRDFVVEFKMKFAVGTFDGV